MRFTITADIKVLTDAPMTDTPEFILLLEMELNKLGFIHIEDKPYKAAVRFHFKDTTTGD